MIKIQGNRAIPVDVTKRCSKCSNTYPAQRPYFNADKSRKDGLYPWCSNCSKAGKLKSINKVKQSPDWTQRTRTYRNRYAVKHPDRLKTSYRNQQLREYGLTAETYTGMLQRQRGLCVICHRPESADRNLAIDHDHLTGKVRGLLCTRCNTGIGLFKEDPTILASAAAYLRINNPGLGTPSRFRYIKNMPDIKSLPLIGLLGPASAGKSTIANMGVELLGAAGVPAISIALADPLKELCMRLFGGTYNISESAFYGSQDEKNAPLSALPGWTGRKILQHTGTEGFRHIDPNIWPRYMIGHAQRLALEGYKAIFVSDVRFASEVDAIRAHGGIVVRAVRPSVARVEGNQGIAGHASETEMASLREDYVINNHDRSLVDLRELVKKFLCDRRFLVSM